VSTSVKIAGSVAGLRYIYGIPKSDDIIVVPTRLYVQAGLQSLHYRMDLRHEGLPSFQTPDCGLGIGIGRFKDKSGNL
jgi:hypothetical protein